MSTWNVKHSYLKPGKKTLWILDCLLLSYRLTSLKERSPAKFYDMSKIFAIPRQGQIIPRKGNK